MLTLFKKIHINWPIAGTILALAVFFALAGGFVYWQVASIFKNSPDSNKILNSSSGGQSSAGDFSIPETYDKPLLIKAADLALSITPLGALPARAEMKENVIKYVSAFDNTDIVQTKYFNKIKEDIILKQPGHPAVFEYQIDLKPYDFSKDADGNLVFYQKGHKDDNAFWRFAIPAPFLIDADGQRSSTAEVETSLTEDGRLILKPSAKWLSSAKYPVTLDPTIEINVLNVHSHPEQGENWTVDFTTLGTADLKIIPNDQATIDDDEFVSLNCGNEARQPQILANDVISYSGWSCPETATVVHYTKKAGNHTLRFDFGGQVAYAYNSGEMMVIFRSSTVIFKSSTVVFRMPIPTSLSLSHSTRSKSFSVSWTAGANNGGAGGCRLQFFGYGNSGAYTWTDITSATSVNCDANSNSASYDLNADTWTYNNWNGTPIRLVRNSDSVAMGNFPQTLSCSVIAGSLDTPTPTIDEDCNGYWDDKVSDYCGTPGDYGRIHYWSNSLCTTHSGYGGYLCQSTPFCGLPCSWAYGSTYWTTECPNGSGTCCYMNQHYRYY